MTKQIKVGNVLVGGGAPVSIQSMCSTRTDDPKATIQQIRRLEEAGCEIVRVAVPDKASAKAIGTIKEHCKIPLVVDIHFDYKLALECIAAGVDKVRINPGNIGSPDRVKAVADACRQKNIPIRIGVNGGSLEQDILAKYGKVCPEALVESAFGHIKLLNRFDFDDICVSLKSSSVPITMQAYQLMRQRSDYPLHLGVTEAGTATMGTIKSAIGIGGLLALGIGDTFRVTLTADPVEEVVTAKRILQAVGLRHLRTNPHRLDPVGTRGGAPSENGAKTHHCSSHGLHRQRPRGSVRSRCGHRWRQRLRNALFPWKSAEKGAGRPVSRRIVRVN